MFRRSGYAQFINAQSNVMRGISRPRVVTVEIDAV